MDEVKPCFHRLAGGDVISLVLLAGKAGDAIALGLQLVEQHLLKAQAIGEELFIKRRREWLFTREETPGFKLLPPGSDPRTAAEEGELAGGNQASRCHKRVSR